MPRTVLVVAPPYHFPPDERDGIRLADPTVAALVSFLRERNIEAYGYITSGHGVLALPDMISDLCTLVEMYRPGIVGVSVNYMPSIPSAQHISQNIKKRFPGVCLVAGGSVVTGLIVAKEERRFLPDFAVFVPGDAEIALFELAMNLTSSIRGGKSLHIMPRRDTPPERLAPLKYDHILSRRPEDGDIAPLREVQHSNPFYFEAITSRACPFKCKFCISPQMGSYRVAPPETLRKTVEEIRSMGVRRFTFDNNHFNLPKKGFADQMQALQGAGVPFDVQARFDCVSAEELSLLRQAGGETVYFGIESFNPRVQHQINKKMSLDMIKLVCRHCHKESLLTAVNLVVGLPGSSEKKDLETMDTARELCDEGFIDILSIGVFVPLPGTDFWSTPLVQVASNDLWLWDADHAVIDVLGVDGEVYSHDRIYSVYRFYLTSDLPVQGGSKKGGNLTCADSTAE